MLNDPLPHEESIWSTILPHTDRDDRGEIRRCWNPAVHPHLGIHGCQTLYEGWRRGCQLNPLGPCLGFRATSTNGLATPFIYSSYTECLARSEALAAGLDKLQLVVPNQPSDNHPPLKVLGLYLKNCPEWVLAEQAVFCIGGCTVPFYDTLGPETVSFILQQTEAKAVVSARAELGKLCETKQSGRCPYFTHVILVDGVTATAGQLATAAGLEVISLAKVEAIGARQIAMSGHHHHHSPPSPNDICTFCYTSGTTGDPKGALLTHANLVAAVAGVALSIPSAEGVLTDRHLSYLPLAHIFERVVMAKVYFNGGSIAFYRGDPMYLIEDMVACRPTILPMVPRVLNKIYDKILANISVAGGFKKKLFDAAVAAKTKGLHEGHLTHALYDRLIFNKIKRGLGMDCLRYVISGSAPLSETVMIFYRCLLSIPIVEGYGQTENAAAATLAHVDDMVTVGHVGGPTGATEVQLFDVPEMNYRHSDRDHGGRPCYGRGEICIRGPVVFRGYYKDEEKTREAIDKEGWLHSGDIGLWRMDGTLQIIDRKKNIFKLSQGEYVAPEKIENILVRSPLIAQCFVHGDSLQSSLVAIVVPDEEVLKTWAKTADETLSSKSFDQVCHSDQLREAIMEDIGKLSQESELHSFETVRAIHVTPELFSVENDLLTPTFKLKRQQARDRYEKEIAELYAIKSTVRSKL